MGDGSAYINSQKKIERCLVACYDLACSPPTYDFVSFLLAAEMERIDRGLDAIEVKILPGPNGGFRKDDLPPRDISARIRMRDNIVVPLCELLPSCRSCEVLAIRQRPIGRDIVGFGEARYGFPIQIAAARRNIYPLRSAPYLKSSPFHRHVTVTLRESSYWPSRNSRLDQWTIAAHEIERLGHRVIIIRDTERADESIDGLETSPVASCDLLYRAALYVNATANLFVNNGPCWLSWFLSAPTLIFRMVSPDAPVVSDQYFRSCGLPPGEQLANARPGQRIVWADDTAETIVAEFTQAVLSDGIDQSGRGKNT